MATTKVTSKIHTATGTQSTKYPFTFPYIRSTDIIVEVDNVYQDPTTKYTFPTATEIQFTSGNTPTSGQVIKIFRDTNVDIAEATFASGSSIRAQDLNNNVEQVLFRLQEGVSASSAPGTSPGIPSGTIDVNAIRPGSARQVIQTNAAGTEAEWTSNVDLPGTLDVTGAATFDTDVNFNTDLIWDDSDNKLKFKDNVKASFGDSDDFSMFWDGSKGIIESPSDIHIRTTSWATDLYLESDSSIILCDQNDSSEVFARFNDDSAGSNVELFYGGSKKFETDAAGCNVIGDLDVSGNINGIIGPGPGKGGYWPYARTISMTGDVVWSVSIDGTSDASAAGTIQTDAVVNSMLADNAVDTDEIVNNAVTVGKIADPELKTLAGMQTGTASVLASGTTLVAELSEINSICENRAAQTTITDDDLKIPTSGAVVDYVTNAIEPLGGLEVIPNEDSFPTTQPASGVVISIANSDGILVDSSNTSTTARTAGNGSDNVTINGFPDTLAGGYSYQGLTNADPFPLPPNTGLLVTSTGSDHIYNYHKLLATPNDVKRLSDDINDFNERYRVGTTLPSTSKDAGDLFFKTDTGIMYVYDSTTSTWEPITAVGEFYINTLSSSSETGGGSATFNGTAYRFTLSNPPDTAQQLLASINGVVQKPNSGTSQPSEGFALDGTDIIFSSAPATGADWFIITIGDSVSIGTPSPNTVTTEHIVNGTILNEDINAAADIAGSKLADDSIAEAKLDIHNAPSGTDKYLKYTSNGMEWSTIAADDVNTTYSISCVDGDNTDEEKIRLTDSSSVTDDVVLEAGTGLSIARSGDKITFTNTVTDTKLTTEEVQDIVGGMVSGNTETNIAVTYDDTNGKLDFVSTDTNTPPLTTEEVQDIVGAMFSGNTETRITVTYEDSDGTIDLVVDDQSSDDNTTYTVSCVDGDNSDEEKIRLTGSDSSTDDVVIEAGTGMSIARSGDKITLTNSYSPGGGTGVDYDDNVKVRFGTGKDLEIFHDGSHSYIKDVGDGRLKMTTNGTGIDITNADGSDTIAEFDTDGAVKLYHDASKKFETASDGVDIAGHLHLTSDNNYLKLGAAGTGDLQIYHDGSNNIINAVNGDIKIFVKDGEEAIVCNADGAVELYYDDSKKFSTQSSGVTIYGDIDVDDGSIFIRDSEKLNVGTGNDLKLYHDGTNSFVTNSTGDLVVGYSNIYLQPVSGENGIRILANGAAELYYDNVKKFETSAAGGSMHGNLYFDDNGRADFGAGNDLQIYHDGSNSFIKENGTGVLNISGSAGVYINKHDNTEICAAFLHDAGCELYHNNSKKWETVSDGQKTHGHYYADDGNKIRLGTGQDLEIYHDGGNSYIDNHGGTLSLRGDGEIIYIKPVDNENSIVCKPNAEVEICYDNSTKFETTSTGITVIGAGRFEQSGSSGGDHTDGATGNYIRSDMGSTHTDRTGTDNYTLKLHNGAYAGTGISGNQGTISKLLFNANTSNGWNSYGAVGLETVGTGGGKGELFFCTGGDNSNTTERMRIDASGRVGIGTTVTDKNAHSIFNIHRSTSDSCYQYFTNSTTGETGDDGFTIGLDSDENALLWNRENTNIRFATNGTEQMELQADGDLKLASGNVIIDTSGKGILFHSHAAANNLDDYEEGTFTPTVVGGDTAGTWGTNNHAGHYVKVGTIVYFSIQISGSISAAGGGQLIIGNLPFTSSNLTGGHGMAVSMGPLYGWDIDSSAYQLGARVNDNSTEIKVWQNFDNAADSLLTWPFGSSGTKYGSIAGTYRST